MANVAPGCFGFPSAISSESPSCRVCGAKGACAKQSYLFLESLPDQAMVIREKQALALTLKGLLKGLEDSGGRLHYPIVKTTRYGLTRVNLTQRQEQFLQSLPKKVSSQTRQLMERGWFDFAREEMADGKNPSLKGWKNVICQQLISTNGKTSRTEVIEAFIRELGHTSQSAKFQTSLGIAIFEAGGLLKANAQGDLALV